MHLPEYYAYEDHVFSLIKKLNINQVKCNNHLPCKRNNNKSNSKKSIFSNILIKGL